MNSKALLTIALVFALACGGLFVASAMDNSETSVDGASPTTATVGVAYTGTITKAEKPLFVETAQDVSYMLSVGNPDGFDVWFGSTLTWMTLSYANDTVTITGTPTTVGTFNVTLGVGFMDGGGMTIGNQEYKYTLVVSATPPLSFSAPPNLDIISGASFSYNATTSISQATKTIESSGTTASWLSINSETLSGIAPEVSSATVQTVKLKATYSSQTAYQTITFTVYPTLNVNDATINGVVGKSIGTFTLTGNYATISWTSSNLPAGLSLNSSTGSITGTVSAVGTYDVTVTASVSSPYAQSVTKTITVKIVPVLSISSTSPNEVIAGHLYQYVPSTNYPENVEYSIEGAPTWLVWDSVSKSVKGVPPSNMSAVTTITYTLKVATTSPVQLALQTVTFDAVPVLEFTSVPTSAMIIIPVYEPSFGSSVLNFIFGDSLSAESVNITSSALTYRFVFVGDSASYLVWEFGDGTPVSMDWTPVHTFANAGEYTVRCTAFNNLGSAVTEQTIIIKAYPNTSSSFPMEMIVAGLGVLLLVLFVLYMLFHKKNVKKGGRR